MAEEDIAQASQELQLVLGRLMRRLRAENTLPLRTATVLALLEREGPLTTSELAQRERMRPQSMAQTIQELELEGLLTRKLDSADRRRWLIQLTRAGRQTLRKDRERRQNWLAGVIARKLTKQEQAVLARACSLLERLSDD